MDNRAVEAYMIEAAEARGKAIGEAIGEAKGKEKKAMEIAKNLLKCGLSIDEISASTALTIEQIKKL